MLPKGMVSRNVATPTCAKTVGALAELGRKASSPIALPAVSEGGKSSAVGLGSSSLGAKLRVEWKNIYRTLSASDIGGEGVVPKKEFQSAVHKHGVFLTRDVSNSLKNDPSGVEQSF